MPASGPGSTIAPRRASARTWESASLTTSRHTLPRRSVRNADRLLQRFIEIRHGSRRSGLPEPEQRRPLVLVPTVNGDNNQHALDENLRIGNFITGTDVILALLSTVYPP